MLAKPFPSNWQCSLGRTPGLLRKGGCNQVWRKCKPKCLGGPCQHPGHSEFCVSVMETTLAVAQPGSHGRGRVIAMPPDSSRCETEPAGFPPWRTAFWMLWGHGQHAGVSWVPPDSQPPFPSTASIGTGPKEFKVAGLLLGSEPPIKLHHAFSTLPFKSLLISERLDVSSFKPLGRSLISLQYRKQTSEPSAGSRDQLKCNNCLGFVLFILTLTLYLW